MKRRTETARILVDADACPVRAEVERAAARFNVAVLLFANSAQDIKAVPGTRVMDVSDSRDGADFALFAECRSGDVVVTDDIGLASMALSRGAEVLSSRGRRFHREEISGLLAGRHISQKARRAGKRTRGPRPLTTADRRRFTRALMGLFRDTLGARRDE